MNESRKINTVLLVTYIFAMIYPYIRLPWLNDETVLLESVLVYAIPMIIYVIFFCRDRSVVRLKTLSAGTYFKAILLFICIKPTLNLLNAITMLIVPNVVVSDYELLLNLPAWVSVVCVGILPPISEELVYRGLVYGTYRKVSPLVGMLISGITFGIMHQNLNQFLYAMVIGVFFALLVEATDSVIPGILIHSLTNLYSVVYIMAIPRLLQYLNDMYLEAVNIGDTVTAELIASYTGGQLTVEEVFSNTTITPDVFLATLPSMLIEAVVGGVLAFLLFRSIARKCGSWDRIKGLFKRKGSTEGTYCAGMTDSAEGTYCAEMTDSTEGMDSVGGKKPRERIVTGTWIAFAILGVIIMALVTVEEMFPEMFT